MQNMIPLNVTYKRTIPIVVALAKLLNFCIVNCTLAAFVKSTAAFGHIQSTEYIRYTNNTAQALERRLKHSLVCVCFFSEAKQIGWSTVEKIRSALESAS
jgi:hypothetical protein